MKGEPEVAIHAEDRGDETRRKRCSGCCDGSYAQPSRGQGQALAWSLRERDEDRRGRLVAQCAPAAVRAVSPAHNLIGGDADDCAAVRGFSKHRTVTKKCA